MSSVMSFKTKTKVECRVSCETKNVFYLITCQKCSYQYVGETKRPLRDRMSEHLRQIRDHGLPRSQITPVSTHFNTRCHKPAQLRFQILQTIRGDIALDKTTAFRKLKEKWWILTLRSLDPLGINALV